MLEHPGICISGRYRLLHHLRRGGMSEVFLALDERTQQQVAIKLVKSDDPECMKRLQREVYLLRKLSHPHILPLLDDGISDGYHYLVMSYMQRGNLRERLARGKMTQEEAGVILYQLADALAYAHGRGIVHRDIKPSNILLDNDDACRVYLADFGIAKALEEGSDITQTGCLIGTPEYMAPELAEKPESASSDIYALGVLLYQMLTGRLPFTGATPLATYWKHIKEQPVPPSALNPDISHAVELVILRALAKDPQHRFPHAQDMALAYASALTLADDQSHTLATGDIRLLPPVQVTLRKVGRASAFAPWDGLWRNGVGQATRRSILGFVALLLLALPITMGFIISQDGSHASTPLSISSAFAKKVVPAVSPVNGGTRLTTQASTPASHPRPSRSGQNTPPEQDHEHGHGHKHGHGHGHGGD